MPTTVLPNPTLTDDFTRKYEKMFFEHIERVITSDSISVEIAEAAISSILSQTETHEFNFYAASVTDRNLSQVPSR